MPPDLVQRLGYAAAPGGLIAAPAPSGRVWAWCADRDEPEFWWTGPEPLDWPGLWVRERPPAEAAWWRRPLGQSLEASAFAFSRRWAWDGALWPGATASGAQTGPGAGEGAGKTLPAPPPGPWPLVRSARWGFWQLWVAPVRPGRRASEGQPAREAARLWPDALSWGRAPQDMRPRPWGGWLCARPEAYADWPGLEASASEPKSADDPSGEGLLLTLRAGGLPPLSLWLHRTALLAAAKDLWDEEQKTTWSRRPLKMPQLAWALAEAWDRQALERRAALAWPLSPAELLGWLDGENRRRLLMLPALAGGGAWWGVDGSEGAARSGSSPRPDPAWQSAWTADLPPRARELWQPKPRRPGAAHPEAYRQAARRLVLKLPAAAPLTPEAGQRLFALVQLAEHQVQRRAVAVFNEKSPVWAQMARLQPRRLEDLFAARSAPWWARALFGCDPQVRRRWRVFMSAGRHQAIAEDEDWLVLALQKGQVEWGALMEAKRELAALAAVFAQSP